MSYQLVPFESWVNQSKPILESLFKDAKVYRYTAYVFYGLGLLIVFAIFQYWMASLIPIIIASVFLYMSRQDHHTLFVHFRIKEKQVYEYADDISGQQLETNYHFQYVVTTEDAKYVKISPKGLNVGKSDAYDKVILSKELFTLVQVGEVMDVLIGSDKQLYAYNINGNISEISRQIQINGKLLTAKTSIYQKVTSFGKRVR